MNDNITEADVAARLSELQRELNSLEEKRRELQNTRLNEIVKSLSVEDMKLLYDILRKELDYDD